MIFPLEHISSQLLPKLTKKSIVLAGGCFDVIHKGHEAFLQAAKEKGDVLLILLESDSDITKRKGNLRPVHSQKNRAEALSRIESVDYIICLPSDMDDESYERVVSLIKPAIIATTKGDPYRTHKENQAKKINAKVIEVIERIPDFSSTNIIKNNYEFK